MRYPDACGAGGRGYGTKREMCALHTASPSCDTLVDFWSSLDEETRSSLLRMREEDFIEQLTRRFNRKKFCRDCRKNVMREFKELKELKRTPRERHCTCWFCVDDGFQCEVFEDGIIVDWRQCLLSEADGSFHHFEWAVGTHEGESDIFGFEDVGMNARVHKTGINLIQFENYYFITLRAWRSDDRCTQYCVKAHVLKGKSACVHDLRHTLVVSDGFVAITTDGDDSMKSFFERAEKVEEEDEDVAVDRDGNDLDADGSHTQKHAKSPELAREFLLDSASVIFKEQVVKAFRDGTAQENAKSVFVSLALILLEERVHVACKELITLEKQNKLLEEEANEMREEQERRIKRKMKEREKKHRQKQKMKGKGNDKGPKLVESKSPDDMSSPALNNSSSTSSHDSTDTPCSGDSANTEFVDLCSLGGIIDPSSCRENKVDHCNGVTALSPTDSSECCCTSEQSDSQDEPGRVGDSQWQSIGRKRRSARGHIGSAQKNTIPKQAWQPLDAPKKTGLYITDNASGCQNLRMGRDEPLPLASEHSSNLCKSGTDHQVCQNGDRGQTASSDITRMLNTQDCYSTHEGFWHEDRMTNSESSSSFSSCTREGDRESSSSSVTISSEQNPESSLYDEPEGCPEPMQKTAMPPSPPCRNGAKQSIGHHPLTDMNLERYYSSNKLKRLGLKDHLPEFNGETQDAADGSFSLFQFSLPIASPVPASSEDDKTNKEFADRTALVAQVQAQLCSREQADVKEYKLFS